jgi:HK97 family phage prohead protease
MKNNLLKINNEILEKAMAAIESKEIQDVIAKTKASSDSGTFEVVISTADQDRQGEIIDQNGWDFTNYKMNPIVLWAHNYCDLPIGVTDELFINDKGQTVAKGRFAPEDANPFAQQVRRLYDAKIVKTASVGFIARETDGNVITKAELLEFSFVPVPANPMALSLAKELKLDAAELMTKGIFVKAEPQEGDPCKLDDGTEGVMTPDKDGTLVCTVKAVKAPADPEEQADQELITKVGAELAAIQSETDTLIIAHSKEIMNLITAEEDADETEEGKSATKERVRTMMSRTKIKIAINGMKATIAALEEILEGSGGKENPDGDSLKQRSNTAGLTELVESLKTFNANRQVLRMVNNITSESLKKINEKVREK